MCNIISIFIIFTNQLIIHPAVINEYSENCTVITVVF
jgi:hypothetical protein